MLVTAVRAVKSPYMDLTIRSGPDYIVRIIERPGEWMSPDALDALSGQLRDVAAKTIPGDLRYGVFSGEAERLSQSIITLVTDRAGRPVAFNALAVMEVDVPPRPVDVLHLGLVMVDPDVRSRSLSWVLYGLTCFLIFFRRQFRPVWISNVTQVPAIVGMVSGMFSDVWPGPDAGRRSLTQLMLGRRIMAGHRHVFGVGQEAGFDEDRFVITDAYTGGSDDLKKTFDEAPKHRNAAFNAFCEAQLDYERGDDVLQLGLMDLAAVRRYLLRDVPKGKVAGLVITAGIMAMARVVLPMVHWFDTRQDWGILRPAGRK